MSPERTLGLLKIGLETSDLGYANGWGDDVPEIVKNCKKAGHARRQDVIGRCLHEISCAICNYKFKVDSSD